MSRGSESEPMTVILKPTTKRLKQLIKQHGECWSLLEKRSQVACFEGPGLFVESADKTHTRWVRPSDTQEG